MTEFSVNSKDLKKALNITILGINDKIESVTGISIFKILLGEVCLVYSTDNDKKALAALAISGQCNPVVFGVNPKNLLSFLSTTDKESLYLSYDPEKNTLIISESEKSYISLNCVDTSSFISFEDDYSNAEKIASVNSDMFINGLKYILGYTTTDEKSKYSSIFIKDGIIYGANGSTHIGVFKNLDLEPIAKLVIRRQMVTAISSFIITLVKDNIMEVTIKITDKSVYFCSPDELYGFGYKLSTIEPPTLPINTEFPECSGYRIDKKVLIKKLTRLALTSKDEIGIKVTATGGSLNLETISERKSADEIPYITKIGDPESEFIIECNRFKKLLGLFDDSKIDLYSEDKYFILYSEADYLINDKVTKRFKQVGTIYRAKIV